MPTDLKSIVNNLSTIYDFTDKKVIHVGAGGGQLLPYTTKVRSVVGVDPDPEACSRLESALRDTNLQDRFRVVQRKFLEFSEDADVVFFEFCLHEMDDPKEALQHAQSMAPDIVVLDHLPESPWAWHTCETQKATKSWAAVHAMTIERVAAFHAVQHFEDHAQLHAFLAILGKEAITRIAQFSEQKDIKIDMTYAGALLRTSV